jgi:hypothetical protein
VQFAEPDRNVVEGLGQPVGVVRAQLAARRGEEALVASATARSTTVSSAEVRAGTSRGSPSASAARSPRTTASS